MIIQTICKILLFGYGIDLFIYYSHLLERKWFLILSSVLLLSGVKFIYDFQLFNLRKRNSKISLSTSLIIALCSKLFTIGDPIFETAIKLFGNWRIAFIVVIGGISIFLVETITTKFLIKKEILIDKERIQILDN